MTAWHIGALVVEVVGSGAGRPAGRVGLVACRRCGPSVGPGVTVKGGADAALVVIEQAEGVLAAQAGVSPEEAFTALRGHSRSEGLRLTDVARSVIDRALDLTSLIESGR